MNNIIKSVVFAAVVLVAGIVAMQAIYNNVADNGVAGIEPAAGEQGTFENLGASLDEGIENTGEFIDEAATDAADAASDAAEATGEFATESYEDAKEAVQDAMDGNEGAEQAAEEPAAGEQPSEEVAQ